MMTLAESLELAGNGYFSQIFEMEEGDHAKTTLGEPFDFIVK